MTPTKVELIEVAFNENLNPVKYILTDKNKLKPLTNVDDLPPSSGHADDLQEIGKKLLKAAASGDLESLKSILTKKIPFFSDWLGTSPLHLAAQNNHVEVCKLLLQAGISKNAQNKLEKTPLHLACYEGHDEIVQVLLEHKVDVNCKDMLGMTALHWAVQKNHQTIIKKLLDNKPDINVTNKFNLTAQDIAKQMEVAEIDQLLEDYETRRNYELANEILNQTECSNPEPFSAVKLLEEHGITMLSNELDDQDILNCAVESGHSVILTDVGKELLNSVKHQEEKKNELSAKLMKQYNNVCPEEFLAMTDYKNINKTKSLSVPSSKPSRITKRNVSNKSKRNTVESLKKQLSEAKKTIDIYKTKLRKKEQEVEEYKKKIRLLTSPD